MGAGSTKRLRRGRGERAGLNVSVIVEAAKALPSDGVTMQAVADSLGVDRKALSNHVADRADLLERVAADAVSRHLQAIVIAAADGWPDACRTYAHGLARAIVATGTLSHHFRWDAPYPALLAVAEQVLGRLLAAGFGDEAAARGLSMLTTLAVGYAQNRLTAERRDITPLAVRLRASFATSDDGAFTNLARITGSTVRTSDAAQLELMIDVFLAGMTALLASAGHAAPG